MDLSIVKETERCIGGPLQMDERELQIVLDFLHCLETGKCCNPNGSFCEVFIKLVLMLKNQHKSALNWPISGKVNIISIHCGNIVYRTEVKDNLAKVWGSVDGDRKEAPLALTRISVDAGGATKLKLYLLLTDRVKTVFEANDMQALNRLTASPSHGQDHGFHFVMGNDGLMLSMCDWASAALDSTTFFTLEKLFKDKFGLQTSSQCTRFRSVESEFGTAVNNTTVMTSQHPKQQQQSNKKMCISVAPEFSAKGYARPMRSLGPEKVGNVVNTVSRASEEKQDMANKTNSDTVHEPEPFDGDIDYFDLEETEDYVNIFEWGDVGHYVLVHATFALPLEMRKLHIDIRDQLYKELFDSAVQLQLEMDPPALNWSDTLRVCLKSRLYSLRNDSNGNCLLDAAKQATWGGNDSKNILRSALANTLYRRQHLFFDRWKEHEKRHMPFALDDSQWISEWKNVVMLPSEPRKPLEQFHILVLAHILRRPIIVYGIKNVLNKRGEVIDFARFQGVYIPFLLAQNFCSKSPIALSYTPGHFTALVPIKSMLRRDNEVTYLPLVDYRKELLPIHFLNQTDFGNEEFIMRHWLDVCVVEAGLLAAKQTGYNQPCSIFQLMS